MIPERKAGILLHISSLPGEYHSGDFGPEAYRFADFLKSAGQAYWQMLPLNQTDRLSGYSPYSALSAFAGNLNFISPAFLPGLKNTGGKSRAITTIDKGHCNFEANEKLRLGMIDHVYDNYLRERPELLSAEFESFRLNEKYWLRNYALFSTIRKKFFPLKWYQWPEEYRNRKRKTMREFTERHLPGIEKEEFAQFLFLRQWKALKDYCGKLGIYVIGDIPIYVSHDSADTWAHPEFFSLKRNGDMKKSAGVPPDYFSNTGQLWNVPVFRWENLKEEGYKWWISRIRKNLEMYDLVRFDHFRGFSSYWEVPASKTNAVKGRWVKGPGSDFFNNLKREFPEMPFIAEDLGDIDRKVCRLRDKYGLPGMRILQFGFGKDSKKSVHAPENHTINNVVYTGTHDNNTTRGWWEEETGTDQRKKLNKTLGKDTGIRNISRRMIGLAYNSPAKISIIPMQDILSLGSGARMNVPSSAKGNWTWRLRESDRYADNAQWLKELLEKSGRIT